MMTINPFATLSESVPSVLLQGFVLVMLGLIFFGTVMQMIHHKNITYFFNNAKKAKLSATRELKLGETSAIIAKTSNSITIDVSQNPPPVPPLANPQAGDAILAYKDSVAESNLSLIHI